ncbi:MAG TPA: DinB family protein [Fimbriimonadaceae bacterium]|nr:DinB family protein [Fimbriimonadaceae bacterium]HRJ31997.1 DinB family protein [Fimbriimonadaceae bacterium]
MDARELLEKTLQNTHYQVSACFRDLKPELWDRKLVEGALTPRETLEHLADCCIAIQRVSRGEKHEWHSTHSPDPSEEGMMRHYESERAKALQVLADNPSPQLFDQAIDYMALHEAYHVGQMVQFRIHFEPEWNSYSIYEGHA